MKETLRQTYFRHFSDYYYEKNNNDCEKAYEEIERLKIQKIEVCRKQLFIWLTRVGIFIGARGENIDDLTKYFVKKTCYEDFKIYMFEQDDLTNEIAVSLNDCRTYGEDYWYTKEHRNNDMDNLEESYD